MVCVQTDVPFDCIAVLDSSFCNLLPQEPYMACLFAVLGYNSVDDVLRVLTDEGCQAILVIPISEMLRGGFNKRVIGVVFWERVFGFFKVIEHYLYTLAVHELKSV